MWRKQDRNPHCVRSTLLSNLDHHHHNTTVHFAQTWLKSQMSFSFWWVLPFYWLSPKTRTAGLYQPPHLKQVTLLFPPAGAAIVTGCSCDLIINILLTMYVPDYSVWNIFFAKDFWNLKTGYRLRRLQTRLFTWWNPCVLAYLQEDESWGTLRSRWFCLWVFPPPPLFFFLKKRKITQLSFVSLNTDIGNGQYQPLYSDSNAPGNYGATNNA